MIRLDGLSLFYNISIVLSVWLYEHNIHSTFSSRQPQSLSPAAAAAMPEKNMKLKPKPKPRHSSKNKSMKPRRGPRLSSSLLKELDRRNPNPKSANPDLDSDSDASDDLYEYEEPLPQEESKKNRRFDPVENFEYELPKHFKDENISSDDEDEDLPSDADADREDEDPPSDADADRHLRMLEGITGMPGVAFQGQKRKEPVAASGVASDAPISVEDLLAPLEGKPGYSELRKRLHRLERKPMTVLTPLPEAERRRIERRAANEKLKDDITKWEPLVKRNREASTLYLQKEVDLGFSTVGAIASEFKPRTEFEKKMAALVGDTEITNAHWKDGARLLELNKISVEDVKDRQNRLAKMRSLLFQHELKSKHIKKIKSKAYHRVLKKEKLKSTPADMQMDPEDQKEQAVKQEFKRAEERMRLKHKNSSKWAKRILKRGLNAQDDSTRAAISEQLHQHELLTRKMNSMKDSDSSSSDDTSDDEVDEDNSPNNTNNDGLSKTLSRAKEKTIKAIEEENETPESGVFTLPFMQRGLKKRKEAAYEEARLALEEFDSSLRQLEDGNEEEYPTSDIASGRKIFGADRKKSRKSNSRRELEIIHENSDNDDEFEANEHEDVPEVDPSEGIQIGSALRDQSEMCHEAIYKSFDDIVKNPGPKTTHDVAIFASDSWRKMKGGDAVDGRARKIAATVNHVLPGPDVKGMDQGDDSESDEEMVDGILSSSAKLDYQLPSQADLIHRAFAGDDVEAEFEKDKSDVLNEENPEPEKPVVLPGWGQWSNVQEKRGTPSWMLEEHEKAKKKREEALQKRKDAHLKHVIISEKVDKKGEKLYAQSLPYPYKSKDVYEHTIRMPLGPDYNPAISVGALLRPEVVKKAGVIINPIKYEEVKPQEKGVETKRNGPKLRMTKGKAAAGKKKN